MTNVRRTQMRTCKLCGKQYLALYGKGELKRAREIHESVYCPSFWEQGDGDDAG